MAHRKKKMIQSSFVDAETAKQLNLLYVCGYCTKIVGDDESLHLEHVMRHKEEISYCHTCCLPIRKDETNDHLTDIHPSTYRIIKLNIKSSLIELRIASGKSFSNFWGVSLPAGDSRLDHFGSVSARWWSNFKNGRAIGCFRVFKSKVYWRCPICLDVKPGNPFNDTVSMRAFALAHLEHQHYEEIMINVSGFLDFEWHSLQKETDFDVKSLMHLATQRSRITQRSFLTFYTIDLLRLENGANFKRKLKRKYETDDRLTRFCLICCCLIPVAGIRSHFRSHSYLEAVAESTSFVLASEESDTFHMETENPDGDVEVREMTVLEENYPFEFPRELFLYTKAFKNIRQDEFKWRCCLCPRTCAQTFATQIIMRMYALRHIEENHKFLFTEEFLAFEWMSIKHEMQASFDIRQFTPLDYTLKGETTFNKKDPNDYMLPQQYYFLTKNIVQNTVICGFCYRSLNRSDFLLHIVIHGFGTMDSETCELASVVHDKVVQDLMGRSNYSDNGLDDEPHNILSVDGKRLKSKMDLMNERRAMNNHRFSELTTPIKSERDTDGEGYTPRSRKSAMDARRILTETFKILQENARNRKNTWNEFSTSSSSGEDNSDDEEFEKALDIEAMTYAERLERSKSKEEVIKMKEPIKTVRRCVETCKKSNKDISNMSPAEIQELIRKEAEKRGVPLNDSSDSSASDSDSVSDNEDVQVNRSKWDSMKPDDIKEMIRQAANRKRVALPSSSSSSDSDS